MSKPPLPQLTREVHATIVEYLRGGNVFETAASAAGVSPKRARAWLELGADPSSEYHAFHRDATAAMAGAETLLVEVLHTAASAGEFKAAQWLLERRYPHWSIKVRQAVEREQEDAVARVLALEPELGAEVVNRVLAAIAGESGEATAGSAEGDGLH